MVSGSGGEDVQRILCAGRGGEPLCAGAGRVCAEVRGEIGVVFRWDVTVPRSLRRDFIFQNTGAP